MKNIFLLVAIIIIAINISGCSGKNIQTEMDNDILENFKSNKLPKGLFRNVGFGSTPGAAVKDAVENRMFSNNVTLQMNSMEYSNGETHLHVLPFSDNKRTGSQYCKDMGIRKSEKGFYAEYHCIVADSLNSYFENRETNKRMAQMWWTHLQPLSNQSDFMMYYFIKYMGSPEDIELLYANWKDLNLKQIEAEILKVEKWKDENRIYGIMCYYPFPKIFDPHTNQVVNTNLNDFSKTEKNRNYLNKAARTMWDKFGLKYMDN